MPQIVCFQLKGTIDCDSRRNYRPFCLRLSPFLNYILSISIAYHRALVYPFLQNAHFGGRIIHNVFSRFKIRKTLLPVFSGQIYKRIRIMTEIVESLESIGSLMTNSITQDVILIVNFVLFFLANIALVRYNTKHSCSWTNVLALWTAQKTRRH